MIIKRYKLSSLEQIFDKLSSQTFAIQTQYKFLKLKNSIKEELEIYRIQYASLLDRFCEKDEEGNLITNGTDGYKVDPKKMPELEKAVTEIQEVEIQIPDIYFSLDELEDLGLTFYELNVLEPFIKE